MEARGQDSNTGDDSAVANACNWLRLIFHALTCNRPICQLGERCSNGKLVLSHLVTCAADPVGSCNVPSCNAVRRLALHWAGCKVRWYEQHNRHGWPPSVPLSRVKGAHT